jgi:hypothetical protein
MKGNNKKTTDLKKADSTTNAIKSSKITYYFITVFIDR